MLINLLQQWLPRCRSKIDRTVRRGTKTANLIAFGRPPFISCCPEMLWADSKGVANDRKVARRMLYVERKFCSLTFHCDL
jgi:hypothetical protein